jgi:hypothetical protein
LLLTTLCLYFVNSQVVTTSLQDPQVTKRLRVSRLLGRLFYTPSSKIGVQFRLCFREWLGRANDCDTKVRQAMVKCLVTMLSNKADEMELVQETVATLVKIIEHDPDSTVRVLAIHQICDLAYRQKSSAELMTATSSTLAPPAYLPARLMQAIGSRVSSKVKCERKDALTGLAQIYHKHYLLEKVKKIQLEGDECSIDIILDTLDEICVVPKLKKNRRSLTSDDYTSDDLDDKYRWIPRKVFECASYTDSIDPDMRNRVIQIVDDVLLGSSSTNNDLTPTSRSVGLAIILESLRDESDSICGISGSNASNWMFILLAQRASLQKSLGEYIDARSKLREFKSGTEEAISADAEAMDKLEVVAALSAPASGGASTSPSELRPILDKLHNARDNHIFRVLATITSPSHSASARSRAFDELPKRTKSLGDQAASWIKTLARRCAMGQFMNGEIVHHSILLAQESFCEGNFQGCIHFLNCVKSASRFYPSLCSEKNDFGTLLEIFSACRSITNSKIKNDLGRSGMVTILSSILAEVSQVLNTKNGKDINADLQAELLHLCTKDGTPEQARHAVYTMAGLLGNKNVSQDSKIFGTLLQTLTSPSRMSISGESSPKIVSILAALAALSDVAPSLFLGDYRGQKAVGFALDIVLLGRRGLFEREGDSETEEAQNVSADSPTSQGERCRPKSPGRTSSGTPMNCTPNGKCGVLEDVSLSVACRRACASIDFLVSFVRSTIMQSIHSKNSVSTLVFPPLDQIEKLFHILHQILQDKGLPPSTHDRRECKSRQDRAALRECAAIHILRLCDGRLQLEKKFLSDGMWHTFSGVLLDEEKGVRDAVIAELSEMLIGKGKYCQGGAAMAPSLRFLALTALCADGDANAGHSSANGNAANVGKRSHNAKNCALQCVTSLRNTCDATFHQCRAIGKRTEGGFESRLKTLLMPEYAVPFAIYLLALRKETPSAICYAVDVPGLTQVAAIAQESEGIEHELMVDEDAQHKMLRKRLRWLFDPLVQSLGDGADNISFLLRMTEVLSSQYQPKDTRIVGISPIQNSRSNISGERSSIVLLSPASKRILIQNVGKLKTTCLAARQVLLRFVKNDANLSTYPGSVQLPSALFEQLTVGIPTVSSAAGLPVSRSEAKYLQGSRAILNSQDSDDSRESDANSFAKITSTRASPYLTSKLTRNSRSSFEKSNKDSTEKGRVHFSPELVIRKGSVDDSRDIVLHTPSDDDNAVEFGDISPIASLSPLSNYCKKTVGTTPPSTTCTVSSYVVEEEEISVENESESVQSSMFSVSRNRRSSRGKALTQDSSQTTSETQFTVDGREENSDRLSKKPTHIVTAATNNLKAIMREETEFSYDRKNNEELPITAKNGKQGKFKASVKPNILMDNAGYLKQEFVSKDENVVIPLSVPKKRKQFSTTSRKTSIMVNMKKKQRLSQDSGGSRERLTPPRVLLVGSVSHKKEVNLDEDMDFNDDSGDDDDVTQKRRKKSKKVSSSQPHSIPVKESSRSPFGKINKGDGHSESKSAISQESIRRKSVRCIKT